MDTLQLENQAWSLFIRLNNLFVSGYPLRYSRSQCSKLDRLIESSAQRWRRRQNKLFNYQPNGFAPSPAQPSGVLGQGTNLNGKYYEIECSECDSESCGNCGLIQGCAV